ncbi:tetratricopeptide repeat protein [Candidatus Thiothrix sp. Deng01]|uniref:Tetratricopeptide repeat protein n=1 Tax=Candidatus Thiothrix phosphatis TaxID=3112415 RepID=A0ABU6CZZ8_9GAMM|nr:tetratricopeptide repeat protein [Candidatus Thiothrix sp. Deng01]MEB4592405.1 tetratricopeptide repeat protein [Candidatus Thiothrix sp. Deng01]
MRNMTEIPQFMEFGQCLADGDLSAGLRCLDECIAVVRAEQDKTATARLLQYKGNILHQSGDLVAARESYQQAYELAGGSPLVLMTLARFLASTGEKTAAEATLAKLESLLGNGWAEQETEYPVCALQERVAEIRALLA